MTKWTRSLKIAFADCASYPKGYYIWKPSAMKKLEELGYVDKVPHARHKDKEAWVITEAGSNSYREAQ